VMHTRMRHVGALQRGDAGALVRKAACSCGGRRRPCEIGHRLSCGYAAASTAVWAVEAVLWRGWCSPSLEIAEQGRVLWEQPCGPGLCGICCPDRGQGSCLCSTLIYLFWVLPFVDQPGLNCVQGILCWSCCSARAVCVGSGSKKSEHVLQTTCLFLCT
jgi:hypothetical protein